MQEKWEKMYVEEGLEDAESTLKWENDSRFNSIFTEGEHHYKWEDWTNISIVGQRLGEGAQSITIKKRNKNWFSEYTLLRHKWSYRLDTSFYKGKILDWKAAAFLLPGSIIKIIKYVNSRKSTPDLTPSEVKTILDDFDLKVREEEQIKQKIRKMQLREQHKFAQNQDEHEADSILDNLEKGSLA